MPAAKKKVRRSTRTPDGFLYRSEFISQDEERQLLTEIEQLPFEQALFQGYLAKRRMVAFGVDYSFESRQVSPGKPFPDFLLRLKDRVTELVAGANAENFVEGLVTEYAPGAAIGWHRDAAQFGIVCGISLLAPCRMRLRLTTKDEYEIASLVLEPRSAYVFRGEARWRWQHSIPPVDQLRYSITLRTLQPRKHTESALV